NAGIGLIRTRAQKSDIAPRARRSGWTSSLSRFAAMQDEGDMGLAAAHSTINRALSRSPHGRPKQDVITLAVKEDRREDIKWLRLITSGAKLRSTRIAPRRPTTTR